MGWLKRSKNKAKDEQNSGNYSPPSLDEAVDSSDDEVVVLDFSQSNSNVENQSVVQQEEGGIEKSTGEKAAIVKHTEKASETIDKKKVSRVGSNREAQKNEFDEVLAKELDPTPSNENEYIGSKMDSDWEELPESPYGDHAEFKSEKLEKLRSRAEDGQRFFRCLIVTSVILMLTANVYVLWDARAYSSYLFSLAAVVPFNTFLCFIIFSLEIRSMISVKPGHCTERLRNFFVTRLEFLRLLWGRGLLCAAAGLLQCAYMHMVTNITGLVAVVFGLIAFSAGYQAAKRFERACRNLSDPVLIVQFEKYDIDQDGFLDIHDFSRMAQDLELDMDAAQAVTEFNGLDVNRKGKIHFGQFRQWRREECWSFEKTGCMDDHDIL